MAGNLFPLAVIYRVVNTMIAFSPLLAVQAQIGDNGFNVECDPFFETALDMERLKTEGPAWGTADKALLDDLVTRARGGELGAMESLYEMFKGPVFGLVYRYAQNRAVAEDLLQDVFLKVFSHMRNVRDSATFPGWIFRIALNTAYSHLRQKRAQAEKVVSLADLEGRVEEPGGEPVERDLQGPLEQAIQALAPRLRSVFILHDVEGYKHEEIAVMLGCAVGTSKSQLFKARIKVRDHLRARKAV